MARRTWTAYLSGEIHSDWRARITRTANERGLPWIFTGPVTDHAASDECGERILGPEDRPFWKDHKAAKLNAIRVRSLIGSADLVVVKFGREYRQWNAAFDAGYAAAIGKPLVVLHEPDLGHALKEVDAASLAVAATPEQVVEALAYVST